MPPIKKKTKSSLNSQQPDANLLVNLHRSLIFRVKFSIADTVSHLLDEVDEKKSDAKYNFCSWDFAKVVS